MLKDEEIERIRSLGISEYLRKPILMEELQECIQMILGRKVISKIPVKPAEPSEPQDTSLRSIVHDLSDFHGIIRIKCENFISDIEDGIHKDKSNKELVKMAVQIMKIVIKTVDRATQAVEKISNLVKKRNE
jgi:hypothetical protein